MEKYAVVWTGSGIPKIDSIHKTREAAERKAERTLRAIQRVPGQQNCGSFHRVFRVENGSLGSRVSPIGNV